VECVGVGRKMWCAGEEGKGRGWLEMDGRRMYGVGVTLHLSGTERINLNQIQTAAIHRQNVGRPCVCHIRDTDVVCCCHGGKRSKFLGQPRTVRLLQANTSAGLKRNTTESGEVGPVFFNHLPMGAQDW